MLILLLIYLIFSNAVTIRWDKSVLFSRLVISGLLSTSYLTYNGLYVYSLYKGIGIYGGLFNITTFTLTFNIFVFLISSIILILSSFYPRTIKTDKKNERSRIFSFPSFDSSDDVVVNDTEQSQLSADYKSYALNNKALSKAIISNRTAEQFSIIEYPLIILFIVCGAAFLISTGDLISVFLSIELQSYGLYILSTIYRDSETSTASGLTYFLLGGLSSCFILLGSALLYGNSGTTNLDNIFIINSISQEHFTNITNVEGYSSSYINLSLVILAVGFLFKVSAAPFHFWSPDVYDGIPTIVTTYVAIVPKISIFAFLLELVYYTETSFIDTSWKNVLLLSSLLSLIIGSVLGLTQFRIKRLFAYSTISHVGFILLALSINNVESVQAYIFYIFQYSISNLNAFLILTTVGYTFYFYAQNNTSGKDKLNRSKSDLNTAEKNNSPIQLINQLKGYFYINNFIAISLAITLFSFVGIPPLIGFFAKQMVLSAALDSGHIFMALVAIITSVIGAAYYLNVIKQIFFYKSDYNISNLKPNLVGTKSEAETNMSLNYVISSSLSSSISISTMLLLLFIYIPGEWFNIVSIVVLILFKS